MGFGERYFDAHVLGNDALLRQELADAKRIFNQKIQQVFGTKMEYRNYRWVAVPVGARITKESILSLIESALDAMYKQQHILQDHDKTSLAINMDIAHTTNGQRVTITDLERARDFLSADSIRTNYEALDKAILFLNKEAGSNIESISPMDKVKPFFFELDRLRRWKYERKQLNDATYERIQAVQAFVDENKAVWRTANTQRLQGH